MIQTILIVLVAVVVLIVIIAVLALRYLRADDSDSFDDIPDEPRRARRPAEQDRERLPAPPGRRPRQPEQVTEVWAADRPARTPDTRISSGFRDRDSAIRSTGPHGAAGQATARRETTGSRPVRASARPDGPGSATSSWDSLSDVDYWAELAADKPEITPTAGAPTAASRHGSGPVSDIRSAAERRAARADRADSGQLPVRKRHQPSRPSQPSQPAQQPSRPGAAPPLRVADASQTEQLDIRAAQAASARFNGDTAGAIPDGPGRNGSSRQASSQRPDAPGAQPRQRPSGGQRPAGPRQAPPAPAAQPAYQAQPPAPAAAYPNGNGNGNGNGHRNNNGNGHRNGNGDGRGPADNDPLTSPSFPAINAEDSRSYRTRRSGRTSGQHARPAAAQDVPSHQFIDYSSAPRRAASRSDGYPVQPAAETSERQPLSAPAANPYGSYVSQPQPARAETARPQTGYSATEYSHSQAPEPSLAAAAYSGYAAGQQTGSAGWYAPPAVAAGGSQAAQPLGQPADGYLPAAGFGGNGAGGSHVPNGSPARGYAGIDYSSIRYDDPEYPDAQLPGYRPAGRHTAQYDQQSYPDAGSGQDGYGAYPGYGTGGR